MHKIPKVSMATAPNPKHSTTSPWLDLIRPQKLRGSPQLTTETYKFKKTSEIAPKIPTTHYCNTKPGSIAPKKKCSNYITWPVQDISFHTKVTQKLTETKQDEQKSETEILEAPFSVERLVNVRTRLPLPLPVVSTEQPILFSSVEIPLPYKPPTIKKKRNLTPHTEKRKLNQHGR